MALASPGRLGTAFNRRSGMAKYEIPLREQVNPNP